MNGLLNRNRLKAMIKKEFRQISRDKRSLGILIFLPVFMLLMFGYALTFDVLHTHVAVLDRDQSSSSRAFIDRVTSTEYFEYYQSISSETEANHLLDNGEALVVIIIPSGFHESLLRGETRDLQILISGVNANQATNIKNYMDQIINNQNFQSIVTQVGEIQGEFSLPIDIQTRFWFNPELKTSKYLIPGLIVYIMMISVVISTAVSIVRERERRTIEQMVVSPLAPQEIILGKTIPYLLISLIATYFILGAGYLLFDMEIKGNHIELFINIIIFLIGGLALGLIISAVAPNQQVAFIAATFATVLPTLLLSGFIFPIESMNLFMQTITYLIPARYFIEILRTIIIKGGSLSAYWPDFIGLLLFMIIALNIARIKVKGILE